jgi:heme/copper-type cytochrome/quinol oxidase subunit 3
LLQQLAARSIITLIFSTALLGVIFSGRKIALNKPLITGLLAISALNSLFFVAVAIQIIER